MKHKTLFFICLLAFSVPAFAQTAKIIDVKGDVSLKKTAAAAWEKAKVNTFLDKEAQIKTGAASKCTLIFDDQMKNVLTVRENSAIVVNELKPVNISLGQGRVFALVDDISAVGKFEIRTPTAVTGVRGTGESVEFKNGSSIVQCLKDVINVQGLDAAGALSKAIELLAGLGVTVSEDGTLSAPFKLSAEDLKAWEDFLDYIETITGNTGMTNPSSADLKNEQQQDYRDEGFEKNRRDEEGKTQGGTEEEPPTGK